MNERPALVDLLTPEEQDLLATKLAEVLQAGFGKLELKVIKGKLRFVEGGPSVRFPEKEKSKDTSKT